MRNNVLVVLVFTVLVMFTVLAVTMANDSRPDLVGEIEGVVEEDLFMIEVTDILYLDGGYDLCVFISSSIEFQELGMTFDYVREVCYYNDYLIFESQGVIYMTNSMYTVINGVMIDNRIGLGGVL